MWLIYNFIVKLCMAIIIVALVFIEEKLRIDDYRNMLYSYNNDITSLEN